MTSNISGINSNYGDYAPPSYVAAFNHAADAINASNHAPSSIAGLPICRTEEQYNIYPYRSSTASPAYTSSSELISTALTYLNSMKTNLTSMVQANYFSSTPVNGYTPSIIAQNLNTMLPTAIQLLNSLSALSTEANSPISSPCPIVNDILDSISHMSNYLSFISEGGSASSSPYENTSHLYPQEISIYPDPHDAKDPTAATTNIYNALLSDAGGFVHSMYVQNKNGIDINNLSACLPNLIYKMLQMPPRVYEPNATDFSLVGMLQDANQVCYAYSTADTQYPPILVSAITSLYTDCGGTTAPKPHIDHP